MKVFEKFSKKNDIKIEKVIDIGCRWGKALKYWKNNNIEAYGVEVSKTMVDYCEKRNLKCYLASATNLSMFKDKIFDLYMATDIYEHLRTKDLKYAIDEAKRVTKKYLLIRPYPSIDKRKRLHLTIWNLEKWESFFKKHNLEIIKVGSKGKTTYRHVFLMEIKKGN